MSRDNKIYKCPECGSKNVSGERKGEENLTRGPGMQFHVFTECHCYHCGHKWREK